MNDRVGRKPLPPGMKRDTVMKVKTQAAAAERFDQVARSRGMDRSTAMRAAMKRWVREGGS